MKLYYLLLGLRPSRCCRVPVSAQALSRSAYRVFIIVRLTYILVHRIIVYRVYCQLVSLVVVVVVVTR